MIINRSTPRMTPATPPLPLKEIQATLPKQAPSLPERDIPDKETLGERLKSARMEANQSLEAIALLLNISGEEYQTLEEGQMIPDSPLLKRIASLFSWNYNELLLSIQNQNIREFQPAIANIGQSRKGEALEKLRSIQQEIAQDWETISSQQQEMLLTQLKMIRDTLKQMKST